MKNFSFIGKETAEERGFYDFLYEKDNHLGNVMVVVSDRKVAIPTTGGTAFDHWKAEVLSAQDYYPFGMIMPGRNFTPEKYRFGFNGKEKDGELKGEGNSYDYGFRIYDPRAGRFLSVDPLSMTYPWYTPYQFAGNKPIWAIDADGAEETGYTMFLDKQYSTSEGATKMNTSSKQILKDVYKPMAVATFKSVFTENLPKKLVEHYAYGKGSPLVLNKTEMAAVHPSKTGIQGLIQDDNTKFDNLVNDVKAGAQVTLPKGYTIRGAANTGGTLGRFEIELKGTITVDKDDPSKWSFEGQMRFVDKFDFVTAPTAPGDLHRTDWGNTQTDFGAKYLPGDGFDVTSEWVDVKQSSSESNLDFFNNVASTSVQNKVSTEIADPKSKPGQEVKKNIKSETK